MTEILLDSNALVSFATDRNPTHGRVVESAIVAAASGGCSLVIPMNVVTEFVYVARKIYNVPASDVRDMLGAWEAMPGIAIEADPPLRSVLAVWPDLCAGFTDAVVLCAARPSRRTVLTFDGRFRRVLRRLKIPLLPE